MVEHGQIRYELPHFVELVGTDGVSNPPLQRRATRCGVALRESPSPLRPFGKLRRARLRTGPTLSLRERGKSPTLPPPGIRPPYRVRGRLFAGNDGLWALCPGSHPHPFGKLRAGFTLSRQGRGGKSPLSRSLFSCVAGSRLPGGRAAGVCGVDGCAVGVRLVPVLFESFPDPALGGGELDRGGLVLLFFLALGAFSESGGPGGSVPATLCSGASSPGRPCGVLGSFGRLGTGLAGPGMGSRLRGNDD